MMKKVIYSFFAKRNSKSLWSKPKKDRVARLITAGLMTPAGQEMIDLAKKTGTWKALEPVDALLIPADLQKLLDNDKKASLHFSNFSPSSKKGILQWILNAKRKETRENRLRETVELAAKNVKANQFLKLKI